MLLACCIATGTCAKIDPRGDYPLERDGSPRRCPSMWPANSLSMSRAADMSYCNTPDREKLPGGLSGPGHDRGASQAGAATIQRMKFSIVSSDARAAGPICATAGCGMHSIITPSIIAGGASKS